MKINTTPGETYIVLSTGGCTVTTGAGKQIKKLAAGQDFFTAMTGDSILSDDNASVTVAKGEILSLLNTDSTGSDVQATLRFQPVTSQSALPATGENGVIYLVPNGKTAPNQYTEWVWTGAAYEQLGDMSVELNGGADTLGGYNLVTTGGAVITERVKVVSGVPSLTDPDSAPGAELVWYDFSNVQGLRQEGLKIRAGGVSLTNPTGDEAYLEAPILRTTAICSLASDDSGFKVGNHMLVGKDTIGLGPGINVVVDRSSTLVSRLVLGGFTDEWDDHGIRYLHYEGGQWKNDVLRFGYGSLLTLGSQGVLQCGDPDYGIQLYTNDSGIATLSIGSQAQIIGPSGGGGNSGSDSNIVDTLYVSTIFPTEDTYETIDIFAHVTGMRSLGVAEDIHARALYAAYDTIRIGFVSDYTAAPELYLGEGVHITGPGWEEMQAAAAATVAEPEQPSFTKLIFPPTGTATAEQDPSWITKTNILMETNGGQLNMTQLTATLAYAAQTPLAIAKRTLWLSTSPGTGDAVQWPANAVFPDDQSQDKIQQLNSNSTYWFDITYVGGQDSILIRKVCSWASTTGESGPTE